MSVIHGKWSKEDIRAVIKGLDEKTGMDGASLPIVLCRSLGDGSTLGTYTPSKIKNRRSFSFSLQYFNDPGFSDAAAIDVIRHEFCHYVVDVLELKKVFDDDNMHGSAWQTVCGLLNTDACGFFDAWHFRYIKEAQIRSMLTCDDIVPVDIMEQIERWGHQIPSLSQRRRLEKRLIKKYSKMRVFSVHDRIYHNKFGNGTVLDTMPEENKQFLYVKFDNGEIRTVQNRQVYKIVNGQIQKPSLKKKAS